LSKKFDSKKVQKSIFSKKKTILILQSSRSLLKFGLPCMICIYLDNPVWYVYIWIILYDVYIWIILYDVDIWITLYDVYIWITLYDVYIWITLYDVDILKQF